MFNTRPWLYYDSSYNVRKFGTKFWIYYDVSNITNKFKSTYIQGILDISGNVVLRNGGFSLPNGDVSMNGNLYVGKNATFIGDASMNGNLYVGLDASFNRNVSIKGNIITNKSIYQIDGNSNMSIASSVGTFPNYGTAAIGPNLISIGNGNYNLVSNGLRDSIAIGSNIINGPNPIGDSNICIGLSNFPSFTSGSNNVGIGTYINLNVASTNDNVFIGKSICETDNVSGSVCIGTTAGSFYNGAVRNTSTGVGMTALGAYNGQGATYGIAGVIGVGAVNDANYRIMLGRASETVDISGGLNVSKTSTTFNTGSILPYSTGFYSKSKIVGFSFTRITSPVSIAGNTLIPIGTNGYNSSHINTGHMDASGVFTAPVNGYYLFHFNITFSINTSPTVITTLWFNVLKNATAYNNGTTAFSGSWQSGVNINYTGIGSATNVVQLNAGDTISVYTGAGSYYSLTNSTTTSAGSNCYGVLLFAS
jgi:hypothetical protein